MKAGPDREPAVTRTRRLSLQLIGWFVAIALVPLAIVTVLTYLAAERALRDQVTTGLYATARRQANQIAMYVREREQNVATLSRLPGTIDALEDFARAFARTAGPSPSFETLDQQYRAFLSDYQEAFGYDDLSLVVPDGRVVFSARRREAVGINLRTDPHRTTGLGLSFDRIRTLLEIDFSDFAPSDEGDVAAFLAAPVLRKNTLLGVVILRLNSKEILRIVSDHTGLGDTGETLLNRRIGNEAVIMVPLRHGSDAPFTRRVALGSPFGIPEQRAVQGPRRRRVGGLSKPTRPGRLAIRALTWRRTRREDRPRRGVRPDPLSHTSGASPGSDDRRAGRPRRPVGRAFDLRSGRHTDGRHVTHRRWRPHPAR